MVPAVNQFDSFQPIQDFFAHIESTDKKLGAGQIGILVLLMNATHNQNNGNEPKD